MSKLSYSVDLTWYNLKDGDAFFIEGWLIASDEKITQIKAVDQNGRELTSHTKWKERPDIAQSGLDIKVPPMPGFTMKIEGVSQWIKTVKKLDIEVFYAGTSEKVTVGKAVDIINIIAESTIIYEVDVLQLLEQHLVVQGWFIDQHGVDEIQVLDGKGKYLPCELYRTVREDARVKYDDYVEKNKEIGFTVKILKDDVKTDQIAIRFVSEQVFRDYRIDMKELQRKSTRSGRLYNALRPGKFVENMAYIQEHSMSSFIEHVKKSVFQEYSNYSLWVKNHRPSREEVLRQRSEKFEWNPVISIVIPLYNTPVKYLKQILDSITEQTYPHWQLCLADGSTENDVEQYIRSRYRKDERVSYKRLTDNCGISENTNEALALATGDYIMLSDHDDIVEQGALYEIAKALNEDRDIDIVYTDEDKITMDGKSYFDPNFKTDYNPYMLESNNYICHIFVVRKTIMDAIGGFRSEFDGAQDYDLILRCCEQTTADKIHHIPKVLYHWRSHPNSTATNPESKRYAYEAGAKALEAHFQRIGVRAEAEITPNLGIYRIHREVEGMPLVSIIIPNKDHSEDLDKCLSSIKEKTTYENYEILVVENNSTEQETFSYYKEMEQRYPKCRLLTWKDEFNYAAINNYAVQEAKGEYILFLNNDVELIAENWIEEMLGICQRPEVGMVGAKLYFPDETIQHAGVILGLGGVAGHIFSGVSRYEPSYVGRAIMPQNLSAVTAACMLMRKTVFHEVGGFDEAFRVAFNDVDLCMKTTQAGYQIVYCPYAELYHYESKSRGMEDTGDKQSRFYGEVYQFETKWPKVLEEGDPFYNVNLSLEDGNCKLREL